MGDRQVSNPSFTGRPGDGTDRAGNPEFITKHSKTSQINRRRERGDTSSNRSRANLGINAREWVANAARKMTRG